jgi:hypothetical protein
MLFLKRGKEAMRVDENTMIPVVTNPYFLRLALQLEEPELEQVLEYIDENAQSGENG